MITSFKFNHHFNKYDKTAFLSALICGLAVHIYKFTNTLPNGDALYNFYDPQNIVASGRWFLSVACAPSSFFDLPWVEGLFSLVYIALTAVVICRIFNIQNKALSALSACMLVSFPGITETFFYGFTADGYFFAMLISSVAIYLSTRDGKKILLLPLSALLICLACGIYQSHVSFALILALLFFVYRVFEGSVTARLAWRYVGEHALVFTMGLLLYYVIWKICLAAEGVSATDYLDISAIGISALSPRSIVNAVLGCFQNVFFALIDQSNGQAPTLYSILNIIFTAAFAIGTVTVIFKLKLWQRKTLFVLTLIALICIIPMSCIWLFASPNMSYRPMMLTCLAIIPIFTAVIFDRYLSNTLGNILALLLALIIVNNGLLANISYFYMDMCYEKTCATALEMTMRMHMTADDEEIREIAIIGSAAKTSETLLGDTAPSLRARVLTSRLQSDLLSDKYRVYYFFSEVLGVEFPFTSEDGCTELERDPEICAMGVWPARDAMILRDGVLIIKIGECP